jgi:hypothetical protein
MKKILILVFFTIEFGFYPDKIWYKVGREVSKKLILNMPKTGPLMSDDLAAFNTLDFTR